MITADYLKIVRFMWSEWARWHRELKDPTPKGVGGNSIVDTTSSKVTSDIEPSDDYYIIQRLIPKMDHGVFAVMKLKYLHQKSNYMISLDRHLSEATVFNVIQGALHYTWGAVQNEEHIKYLSKKLNRKLYEEQLTGS